VDEPDAELTVVGFVGDVAPAPGEAPAPTIYLAYAQHAALLDGVEQRARVFAVRAEATAGGGIDAAVISRVVAGLDPELPISAFAPLTERLADLSFRPRLSSRILGAFALLALALASVGLYSLLADAVGRRRREIGIRIALGAGKGQVVALLGRPTARLVAAGIAAGAFLAVLFVRWLASRVEGVLPRGADGLAGLGAIDWTAALPAAGFALALLLTAVTFATAAPIRRALRTEPRDVLSE
jgi:ABC-type antimicrobial peptide transport system permease subunit